MQSTYIKFSLFVFNKNFVKRLSRDYGNSLFLFKFSPTSFSTRDGLLAPVLSVFVTWWSAAWKSFLFSPVYYAFAYLHWYGLAGSYYVQW